MKKIVSNILIVSTQLIVGGLFLFMLFSGHSEDNRIVVVENNNLDKMADSVSELFEVDHAVAVSIDESKEEELVSTEQKAQEEEAKKQEEAIKAVQDAAEKAAQEEAARKAQEEAAAVKAQEEAQAKLSATYVDASGYLSNPAMGFTVTTGNRTYSLSDEEFNIVAGVIGCEAASDINDALAVATVILNRADRRGQTPVQVVSAPYQFSCYSHQKITSNSIAALQSAISGIRNSNYDSFNGWYSGVSNNYIVSGGNRYY